MDKKPILLTLVFSLFYSILLFLHNTVVHKPGRGFIVQMCAMNFTAKKYLNPAVQFSYWVF